MRAVDAAWLAGILEGEGSFYDSKGCPTVQVAMTDPDIIVRAATLMGVRPRKQHPRKEGYKPVSGAVACGTRAVGVMMTIYTLLGTRRRERVRGIIARWKGSSRMPRAPRGQRFMATCHPDRVRCGKGLCRTCYMRQWRAHTGRDGTYYRNRREAA